MRIPPEFHQVVQGKVPFQHGSSRVSRGSARAAGWSRVVGGKVV